MTPFILVTSGEVSAIPSILAVSSESKLIVSDFGLFNSGKVLRRDCLEFLVSSNSLSTSDGKDVRSDNGELKNDGSVDIH